jgi:serine-type D-Ala-D-Ala carboxypeptidase (penicillin-binding protein 5/6)
MRFVTLLLALLVALPAQAFETKARAAYVLDLTTGTVLLAKDADEPLPPASMSKLMTVNMLFEALRDGRVQLDTRFTVSTRAKSMQGSTMFLNETDRPTVEELIRGIVILSGNDATVAVAEGLSGSEDLFAEQMTERARALGMTASTFANASGWPDPDHRMSVHDLTILAARLITEFPEYYPYFAETEFPFDNRAPDNRFNRNPLLGLGIGADGLKTGHTEEAGYGLVGSAKQGNRRIVFALQGLGSEDERAREAEAIVNWAFRQFSEETVVKKGETVTKAEVWMGEVGEVELVAAEDVTLLVPALHHDGIPAKVNFTGPVAAPVAEGAEVGTLTLLPDGLPPKTVKLVTKTAVAGGGFLQRLGVSADRLRARYLGFLG